MAKQTGLFDTLFPGTPLTTKKKKPRKSARSGGSSSRSSGSSRRKKTVEVRGYKRAKVPASKMPPRTKAGRWKKKRGR